MLKSYDSVKEKIAPFLDLIAAQSYKGVDEARWFQIDEAIEMLSYWSEQQIMQKAKGMIEGM